MMLRPSPFFDWKRVKWGGPHDVVAEACSYCGTDFREDEVPLRFWAKNGAACAFCEACAAKWWGMETFREGPR
jgi:hypothetical protein